MNQFFTKSSFNHFSLFLTFIFLSRAEKRLDRMKMFRILKENVNPDDIFIQKAREIGKCYCWNHVHYCEGGELSSARDFPTISFIKLKRVRGVWLQTMWIFYDDTWRACAVLQCALRNVYEYEFLVKIEENLKKFGMFYEIFKNISIFH